MAAVRRALTLLAVVAVAATGLLGGPAFGEPDPLRVLVYSQPHGFSHTASIVAGDAFLDALDGEEMIVDVTKDPQALVRANLDRYDVLVWSNSTGDVPLPQADKDALVDWARAGHGFVGVHSAADSNYSWPEFAELIGGYYHGHWYRFGGMTPEPYRMNLIVEDPDNPILAGVPEGYTSYDETYKWQVDVRPDVHVLQSMDNASIYGQGALYDYHQPITWCRPIDQGRTFYTNLGHDGALWEDDAFTAMVVNGIRYAGGRLEAGCDVPADPYTGVTGAERLRAVWADEVVGAAPQVSTYSGGSTVLTRIQPDAAAVTFADVDLTGVQAIDVFATAQTISAPGTFLLAGTALQQRIAPATGGTVEIRVDSVDGPVIGTVTIPPAPGVLSTTSLPAEAAAVQAATGPVASWSKLTADIAASEGVHDLVLTFPSGPLNEAVDAVAPERNLVGSLGWVRLVR